MQQNNFNQARKALDDQNKTPWQRMSSEARTKMVGAYSQSNGFIRYALTEDVESHAKTFGVKEPIVWYHVQFLEFTIVLEEGKKHPGMKVKLLEPPLISNSALNTPASRLQADEVLEVKWDDIHTLEFVPRGGYTPGYVPANYYYGSQYQPPPGNYSGAPAHTVCPICQSNLVIILVHPETGATSDPSFRPPYFR